MKKKEIILLVLALGFLTSCGDLSKKAEEKLDKLMNKAESLDSLINKEVDKVLVLDSLINTESEKVKKLDSLMEKSASRLDSIVNEKINRFKK